MDNTPKQTGYNTEIHRVKRLVRINFSTTEPHSPWKNKDENVINIIKEKGNRRRVQINITKRVWYFGVIWESDIYFCTVGKDGRPSLERLTGDIIYISEWLEFEFYDLVWFCNNKSDDIKPMLGQRLVVSPRVGSML